MILSVLLVFISTICPLWAIRQTSDLNDIAFSTFQTNQAGQMQITVRNQHVIVGHTSLNSKTVYSLKAENGKCPNAIKKVSDFAREQLLLSPEAGRSIDGTVDEAWLRDKGTEGPRQLSEAFAVLDQSDLRDAMQTKEVWTLNDQDILIKCETNETIRVEEEAQTDDGSELLQGDILAPMHESPGSLLELKTLIRKGASWAGETWPKDDHRNKTVISYCFDPDLHEEARTAFLKAINHTQSQIPCLQFVNVGYNDGEQTAESKSNPMSCSVIPSIKVQNIEDKCWSYVGMERSFLSKGESQPLNLGKWCWTMAIAAHELGHALGMLHEQIRRDRDFYVTVHWDNIPEDKDNNFKKQLESWDVLSYDPLSLMQYEPWAFAFDETKPTITAINPKMTRLLGQRQGWSEQDVIELGSKYCLSETDDLDLARLQVHPFIKQEQLLERSIGKSKFNDETPIDRELKKGGCVKFTLCSDLFRTMIKGAKYASGLNYCKVENTCDHRVRITCSSRVLVLSAGQMISTNNKQVGLRIKSGPTCTLVHENEVPKTDVTKQMHDREETKVDGPDVEEDKLLTNNTCILFSSCSMVGPSSSIFWAYDANKWWCRVTNFCDKTVRIDCPQDLGFIRPGGNLEVSDAKQSSRDFFQGYQHTSLCIRSRLTIQSGKINPVRSANTTRN